MQGGQGFGSILAGLFRGLLPALKSGGRALLQSGIKVAKSGVVQKAGKKIAHKTLANAKKAASNAIQNALEGKSVKTGAKADLKKATRDIGKVLKATIDNGANGNGHTGGKRVVIKKSIGKAKAKPNGAIIGAAGRKRTNSLAARTNNALI
jgi:hypothetical protein